MKFGLGIGFSRGGAGAAESGTWTTVYTLNASRANSAGWLNYNFRNVYDLSEFSATGGTKMRLTMVGPSSGEGCDILEMYVGEAAASGDAWDFAATPTQVLFSGGAGHTLAVGTTKVSDEISIGKAATGKFIISTKMVNAAADDTVRRSNTGMAAGSNMYYSNGGDASAVAPGGYSTGKASYGFVIVQNIELLI